MMLMVNEPFKIILPEKKLLNQERTITMENCQAFGERNLNWSLWQFFLYGFHIVEALWKIVIIERGENLHFAACWINTNEVG